HLPHGLAKLRAAALLPLGHRELALELVGHHACEIGAQLVAERALLVAELDLHAVGPLPVSVFQRASDRRRARRRSPVPTRASGVRARERAARARAATSSSAASVRVSSAISAFGCGDGPPAMASCSARPINVASV